jgi:membrane protein YqaA with SNARE-associated domain
MKHKLGKFILFVEKYSSYWWYGPLLAFLAAIDAYVFVVSVEAFLLPAVLAKPKNWPYAALWGTVGSTIGATSFAMLTSKYGEGIVQHFFPKLLHSKSWAHAVVYITNHGAFGLAFISVGPLPQHAAVAIAGLAHMHVLDIVAAVFVGRGIKYFFLAYLASHSPQVLRKLKILPEIDVDPPGTPAK